MSDTKPITRQEIAAIVNGDVRAIRAFEKLFTNTGTYLTDAPSDGNAYGRLSAAWSEVFHDAASVIPAITNLYDLGSNAVRWKDLYLSGDLAVGDDIDAIGDISGANLSATTDITAGNDITATGDIVGDTLSGANGSPQFYVDRGDPGAWDFDATDMATQDGSWNDLDLSSIVPATAANHLVHIRMQCTDNDDNTNFSLRENGNSNDYNIAIIRTASGVSVGSDFVLCDSSRVIEYRLQRAVDSVYALIKGWFIDA